MEFLGELPGQPPVFRQSNDESKRPDRIRRFPHVHLVYRDDAADPISFQIPGFFFGIANFDHR
jgi:hypothetical protein